MKGLDPSETSVVEVNQHRGDIQANERLQFTGGHAHTAIAEEGRNKSWKHDYFIALSKAYYAEKPNQKAIEKLKQSAGDPEANLTAGRYSCFYKDDWAKGLSMLARGSDAALKDVASRGERSVEAYGVATQPDYASSPLVGVEFLLRSGFTVLRPHPDMPLMRLDLPADVNIEIKL